MALVATYPNLPADAPPGFHHGQDNSDANCSGLSGLTSQRPNHTPANIAGLIPFKGKSARLIINGAANTAPPSSPPCESESLSKNLATTMDAGTTACYNRTVSMHRQLILGFTKHTDRVNSDDTVMTVRSLFEHGSKHSQDSQDCRLA